MVDRVAQALFEIQKGKYSLDINHGLKPKMVAAARAAIAAMREPTEEVIKAHHVVPDDTDFDDRAARNWRAMIDAALA